jgi:serine phosphatase RsbU (regulator of sigma subunit)
MTSMTAAAVGARKPGRVLVIDDDPHVSTLFRHTLERQGHEVFAASNGKQGLAIAAQESPELILLDLNMPVMGGLEVLRHLSKDTPDLPVIIISGTGEMGDAIEALRLGAWDYQVKPLPSASALVHTVEMNLERSRLIRQHKKVRQELDLYHEQVREDEEAGRKIQAKLSPANDWKWGPYRFQHRVIPSLLLSGDFVDYFNVDEQFSVFYCADVSGHGVSSALITVLVKGLITKHRERFQEGLSRLILEPDRLLTQLNRDLLQENLDKHLTLFYGVLNQSTNTLCYSCAGHYPPALLFSDGKVRELAHKGMAVGLFPFAAFQSDTIPLPPTFRLTVFSDGALDALPLPTPEARLAHLQRLRTEESLREFVDESSKLKHLPDDLTVLSVTRGKMP